MFFLYSREQKIDINHLWEIIARNEIFISYSECLLRIAQFCVYSYRQDALGEDLSSIIHPNYRFHSKKISWNCFGIDQEYQRNFSFWDIMLTLGWKDLNCWKYVFSCVMSFNLKNISELNVFYGIFKSSEIYTEKPQKYFWFTINCFVWTEFWETVFRNNLLVAKLNYIFL